MVGRAGIERGGDQGRLARQRDAGALEEDEQEQDPQAVGPDQIGGIGFEQCHGRTTFKRALGPWPPQPAASRTKVTAPASISSKATVRSSHLVSSSARTGGRSGSAAGSRPYP